ncbi:hypothetical protein XBP1_480001 [Xenorhabdus bovienii str. puntauvense]|uniref:Uncharacterized protein n=1 Tax=Xenorhabdus bovienii str. puntauvense TaxID=1398201 RepID=A0A077NLS1_XENBV
MRYKNTYKPLNFDKAREVSAVILTGLNIKKISELYGISERTVREISGGKAWVKAMDAAKAQLEGV